MNRFLFLDRDGTLVRDVGYPHRLEDYELLSGVRSGLRRLADAGFRLVIVTNQSGLGRGYFTKCDFEAFHGRLLSELEADGIRIERSYLCPHAPEAGCDCRKPAPGLLWRARDELGADLAVSWVIGNGQVDVELARRAGCRGSVRIEAAAPSAEGAEKGRRSRARTPPAARPAGPSEPCRGLPPRPGASSECLELTAPDLEAAADLLLGRGC